MGFPQHSAFILLLGGMALFMFGIHFASDHLQRLAANRVRELIAKLSNRRLLAIGAGVVLTVLLQSSGAVTSLLVNLGTAKVINIQQVMAVILGSAIGSTFTVQLVSFNIAAYGLSLLFFSFMVYFLSTKRIVRNISGIFLGFGIVFFGLELMTAGNQVFRENPFLLHFLEELSANPLLCVIVTSGFAAVIQSSAVTIGLAMALATSHIINLETAMYWVYGANIGTTSTALIASLSSNYVGRQIAWSHFFYKTGSVMIFYFFTPEFVDLISTINHNPIREIANAHTVFNILSALLFLPFIQPAARGIERLITKNKKEEEFSTQYLSTKDYADPKLALAHAERETLRMGDIVVGMIRDSIDLFKSDNPDLQQSIRERDNQVDLLHREIKLFLVQMNYGSGNLEKSVVQLIEFTSDLEAAADVIENGVMHLSLKKQDLKLEFSARGWEELQRFHEDVVQISTVSLSVFQTKDPGLAKKVINLKRTTRYKEEAMRESHLKRLNQGLKESLNTSTIHLDLLADYRRVVSLVVSHAYNLEHRPENPLADK